MKGFTLAIPNAFDQTLFVILLRWIFQRPTDAAIAPHRVRSESLRAALIHNVFRIFFPSRHHGNEDCSSHAAQQWCPKRSGTFSRDDRCETFRGMLNR
jgi:hypothetical protein